ncbi:MAG: UDP-N-acetylglucosamine 2-epimerase (non-hydrolyzing), partial [Bacteroidota bacterium]
IKITQFRKEFSKYPEHFEFRLLHTGQHYDKNMSQVFFEQLKLQEPDYYMGIQAGHPADQMGRIISGLVPIIQAYQPNLIMVVGDVNSTFAAALAANKFGIKIAHVESGLRSRYRDMPEEINRILTDEITDIYFITEQEARENLEAEGRAAEKMFFVGNTMIDTLVAFDDAIQESPILEKLNVSPQQYVLMTMHRPRNVDTKEQLLKLIKLIKYVTSRTKVVIPIHPRTRNRLVQFNLWDTFQQIPDLVITEPLGYLDFQKLISQSKFVLTDSGGIQEETTFRQVPCLTLRPSTERPITVTLGSNELIDFDLDKLKEKIDSIENGTFKKGSIPPMWDGQATKRIVASLKEKFYKES